MKENQCKIHPLCQSSYQNKATVVANLPLCHSRYNVDVHLTLLGLSMIALKHSVHHRKE